MKSKERIALEKLFDEFAQVGHCNLCFGNFAYSRCPHIGKYYIEKHNHACGVCMELFPKLRKFRKFYYGKFTYLGSIHDFSICMCYFCHSDFQKSIKKAYRYINGHWG
jgi:hypothetical protein